jgi:transcription termination factor Rho
VLHEAVNEGHPGGGVVELDVAGEGGVGGEEDGGGVDGEDRQRRGERPGLGPAAAPGAGEADSGQRQGRHQGGGKRRGGGARRGEGGEDDDRGEAGGREEQAGEAAAEEELQEQPAAQAGGEEEGGEEDPGGGHRLSREAPWCRGEPGRRP